MTESSEPTQPSESQQTEPIVAAAGQYYRNTRYIMFVLLLGYGLWSIRDGYYRYPRENEQAIQQARTKAIAEHRDPDKTVDTNAVPHPGWDVPFNKVIGVVMPPLSLLVLAWTFYNSRGEYRLEGNTLHVPGHPPVPFENITEIDQRLWDRKGIARISYDLGNGQQGTLVLDDFVYDRPPTDEIYERIEKYANPDGQKENEQSEAQKEAHG